jgi:hypothetical protein
MVALPHCLLKPEKKLLTKIEKSGAKWSKVDKKYLF